ncbi:AAA family ATPase [Saccharopolyspora taberi]|uniref:AAA domain-containing protein n=1 Tax=Saccharopolyspora taberi TaxID=60895 RepID=A0ABN3V4B2_9PSEU
MARLIHLNGPPGIGKSTLAERYADEHVGVLNLDADRLRVLVGGWRERFAETGALVRPIAMSMAATHLRAGHDVVMPQFLGRLSEIERFERVAHDSRAEFREVVLMDTAERSAARFLRRGEQGRHRWVKEAVERDGGPALLAEMHDRLTAVLRARPDAVVVRSAEDEVEQTYRALLRVLTSS